MKKIPLNKAVANIVDATIVEEADYMKIKTFSDANNGELLPVDLSPDENAYRELRIIVKAINNNKNFPDWTDTFQEKWHPVFTTFPKFRLVDSVKHDAPFVSTVGSFFVFESKEKSDYAAKQFVDYYETLMMINHE
jgi:hypothetical protein